MSYRSYAMPVHRPRRTDQRARTGVWLLTAAVVLLQICYPLVHGSPRNLLTVVTVIVFASASVAHAAAHRGAGWASGYLVLAAGTGFAVEVLGVATGFPFGHYSYGTTLGPRVFAVPLVIALAWAMFAYPCLVVARRLGQSRRWPVIPIGAVALAGWDLFLDPQMVAAGHWNWAHQTPAIPGIPGIPVSNFAGWLVVSLLLMTALHLLLPETSSLDGPPALLFLWTYVSSVLSAAVFFDRPGVAVVGGVVLGLVAVPYAVCLWDDRP